MYVTFKRISRNKHVIPDGSTEKYSKVTFTYAFIYKKSAFLQKTALE